MHPHSFDSWLQQLTSQALLAKQRCIVVLEGDVDWVKALLSSVFTTNDLTESGSIVESLSKDVVHVFGEQLADIASISAKNYRQFLGTEMKYLIFADREVNIDAFAALSGTVIAGGVLFFICIRENEQANFSHFNKRFYNQLLTDNQVNIICQNKPNKLIENTFSKKKNVLKSDNTNILPCLTNEQFEAVSAIKKVQMGHRNRPLVLTADRGRGKSSALAIACSQLMRETEQSLDIIISAPHQRALSIFFSQLKSSLPEATHSANQCIYKNHQLRFLPIDIIATSLPDTSLLLIDEAAAIPVYILEHLLSNYHRIAFASTQHGYEGAGRGFTLKFQKILDKKYPQWRSLHMKKPIRWAEHDPLERFVFDSCLLNAELPSLDKAGDTIAINQLEFCLHNAKELCNDEALLSSVFAVLVTAHYQTSPSDLKMLLDNKNLVLVTLQFQQQVVGVALLMHEGHGDIESVLAVKNNTRRLKDQFLPQSLLTHCGVKSAFGYRYLRVMRIAVLSQYQKMGIGQHFLSEIKKLACQQQVDFLGTSFGLNEDLFTFWQNQKFQLARIGVTQDKASGEYSAMLLQGLTAKSKALLNDVQCQFFRAFDYQLAENYPGLSARLVLAVLANAQLDEAVELSEFDRQTVQDFANKERQYANCIFSLRNWLLHELSLSEGEEEILPLISKILQKKPNSALCKIYGFSGQKEINQYLVSYVANKLLTKSNKNVC